MCTLSHVCDGALLTMQVGFICDSPSRSNTALQMKARLDLLPEKRGSDDAFGRANETCSQDCRGMRSMRMPPRAFTISWLLLVAMLGAVGLTRAATDASGEKIGDFLKYANGTALDTRTTLMWM